jgi:solute carrier family 25 citrate transporter 1
LPPSSVSVFIRLGFFQRHHAHTLTPLLAGLSAGITEAVLVVTPMDVIKIRLQAQKHSMTDPMDIPKYRNAFHCAYEIVKAEGFGALYKGVALTALRQCKSC